LKGCATDGLKKVSGRLKEIRTSLSRARIILTLEKEREEAKDGKGRSRRKENRELERAQRGDS